MCSVPRQSHVITIARSSSSAFTPAAVMPAVRARTASRPARRFCDWIASSRLGDRGRRSRRRPREQLGGEPPAPHGLLAGHGSL